MKCGPALIFRLQGEARDLLRTLPINNVCAVDGALAIISRLDHANDPYPYAMEVAHE